MNVAMLLLLVSLLGAPVFAQGMKGDIIDVEPIEKPMALAGMDWSKKHLVLLPREPRKNRQKTEATLVGYPKEALLLFMRGEGPAPKPEPIWYDDDGVEGLVGGFQGYSGVAVVGEEIYFSMDAEKDGQEQAWLAKGYITPAGDRVTVDYDSLMQPAPSETEVSVEALANADGMPVAFLRKDERLIAQWLDSGLELRRAVPVSGLEDQLIDVVFVDDEEFYALVRRGFGKSMVKRFKRRGDAFLPRDDRSLDVSGAGPLPAAMSLAPHGAALFHGPMLQRGSLYSLPVKLTSNR